MRLNPLVSILLLSCAVGSASAQDAVKSPRDVATGQTSAVLVSNESMKDFDIRLVSIGGTTVREAGSGQASGRRQYVPARTTTGIWSTFEHGEPVDVAQTTSAVVKLTRESSTCLVRVAAAFNAAAKRLEMRLGNAGRFFDAAGKPVASLCNG